MSMGLRFKLHLAVNAVLWARQLQSFIKEEKLVVYWTKPNLSDKYSVIATTPGDDIQF
jgi:hypothetical protein